MPSCRDCQKYVYTIPDGELQKYEVEDEDGRVVMLPVLRDPDVPPPCDQCPKGSPKEEFRYVLGPRNMRAFDLYERIEATHGLFRIPEWLARCEVFAENMRIIKAAKAEGEAVLKSRIMEEAEKERLSGA